MQYININVECSCSRVVARISTFVHEDEQRFETLDTFFRMSLFQTFFFHR